MAQGFPRKVAEFMAANPPPQLEVWPENWEPYLVFSAVRTQWRMSMSGPVGLDHNVIPDAMRRVGVKKKRRDDVFVAIQVMEDAALSLFAEQRDKRNG